MTQRSFFRTIGNRDRRRRWLSSPVSTAVGHLPYIYQSVPEFERRAFGLTDSDGEKTRIHERLDLIVRKPFGDDQHFVPLGAVSKNYILIPHKDVLDIACEALQGVEIDPWEVQVELTLTEYGERMHLSIYLPPEYYFDPGDGNLMAMRLECLNSVDGSTRFQAFMGWYRFICSNGLIIGVTHVDLRRRHTWGLNLLDIIEVLNYGLLTAGKERENLSKWQKRPITIDDRFTSWVEKDVFNSWGFKAAARAYHIAMSGYDVDIVGAYKDQTPTTIDVRKTKKVPGMNGGATNAFAVSQVLAWLAKERNDVQEQYEWRRGIPNMMTNLIKRY
jgi:hypothetical protein